MANAGTTTRVSVSSAGRQGNDYSRHPSISARGRYIAFLSVATNLVVGDTNGAADVFVHDRLSGRTSRVSADSTGQQGNADSVAPAISASGRFVAFESLASNLVAGDTNGVRDVFVHNRRTGVITRLSVDSTGRQGNRKSTRPAISVTGHFVAFESFASNLVGGDTNGVQDVFVHDPITGRTNRVSVDSTGHQGNGDSFGPVISAAGRFIAFASFAANLVAGDTNGVLDVFVHDRHTGITTRVSVDSAGGQGNGHSFDPAISANGRFVSFLSAASNLVLDDTNGIIDIFVHDRSTGGTTRVSVDSAGGQGNDHSRHPSICGKGRFIAFHSAASNLVEGDTNAVLDVFVHDRSTGVIRRVSVDTDGHQGNFSSLDPAISARGCFVAFESFASNLVLGDTNDDTDVFVHDRK